MTPPRARTGPKPLGRTAKLIVRVRPELRLAVRTAAQSAGVSMNVWLNQQLSSVNGASSTYDETKQVRPA